MIKLDRIKSKAHNKCHNHMQESTISGKIENFQQAIQWISKRNRRMKMMRKALKKNKKIINNTNDELRDLIMVKIYILKKNV